MTITGTSTYPAAADSFDVTKEDADPAGQDLADARAALNAIEGELGLNPAGGEATVAARLGVLADEDYVDNGDANALQSAQDYADGPLVVETIAGNYTLDPADVGVVKEQTSGSASNFTVPENLGGAFEVGHVVSVVQAGAGTVTLVPGTNVDLRSPGGLLDSGGQWSTIHIRRRATNEYVVSGDLA